MQQEGNAKKIFYELEAEFDRGIPDRKEEIEQNLEECVNGIDDLMSKYEAKRS
jgi:hypothetical protein